MKVAPRRIRTQIIVSETPYELSISIEAFCKQDFIQEVYDIKYQHSIQSVWGNDNGIYSRDIYSAMIIYEEE